MEKSKVSIQFLLTFRQSGDVLLFLYACRLRGYTATTIFTLDVPQFDYMNFLFGALMLIGKIIYKS